jgi:hypothetical protein
MELILPKAGASSHHLLRTALWAEHIYAKWADEMELISI